MGISGSVYTRRRVLGTAAVATGGVATLTGCGLFDSDPEPIEEPDPLQPVLDEALTLAAAYERAASAQPDLAARLTPLAADHRAHAAELATLIGADPPSAAASAAASAGPDTTDTLAGLRTAEQAAQRTATISARTAPAGRAALVGSIAACRASHVEALR